MYCLVSLFAPVSLSAGYLTAEAEVISNLLGKVLLPISSWSHWCFLFPLLYMARLAGQHSLEQSYVSTEHAGASPGQQTQLVLLPCVTCYAQCKERVWDACRVFLIQMTKMVFSPPVNIHCPRL